jgi:hypothetical protein
MYIVSADFSVYFSDKAVFACFTGCVFLQQLFLSSHVGRKLRRKLSVIYRKYNDFWLKIGNETDFQTQYNIDVLEF